MQAALVRRRDGARGASYLGFVQWAVADRLPPQVKAMIPHVTESGADAGVPAGTACRWRRRSAGASRSPSRSAASHCSATRRKRRNGAGTEHPAARQADVVAIGHRSDYIQDVLAHDETHPRWDEIDHRDRVADVTVPVSSVGGWYDIFLPGQLRDFRTLQDAGRRPRLTVGPWTHAGRRRPALREALEFGLAHARGEEPPERAPVRLFVMGEEAWRDFAPGRRKAMRRNGSTCSPAARCRPNRPRSPTPDRYRYDPADPTPAAGGVRMAPRRRPRRQHRPGSPRRRPHLHHGRARRGRRSHRRRHAEIWFRCSLPFADVFVRLCDVDPDGRSWQCL